MQIIATGPMTYVTKQLLKRLADGGHEVHYERHDSQRDGCSAGNGARPEAAGRKWLIAGGTVSCLDCVPARTLPLHPWLTQMGTASQHD